MMRPAAFSVALCLALSSVAKRVSAEAFAASDQALWIDRHNYFRMTALPFAAGNMLRMKWSADLATQAEADASACAAKTSAGVNAALVASSGSPVDAAMQTWAVDTAMGVFGSLKAPQTNGDPVGTGVYNSYSQVVWSSTNEVGCAKATCGSQVGVACRYSPAGNDGTSPWYIHGAAGSACPSGLVSKVGLCVTSADDPSYNAIAPIPDGQNSYEVFKDFIPNMQKALAGQAVAPAPAAAAASDAASPAAATPAAESSTAASTPAAATPASGTDDDDRTDAATSPSADGSDAAATPAADSTAKSATSTGTTGHSAVAGSSTAKPSAGTASSTPTGDKATSPSTSTTGSATPAPSVTKIVNGKVYVRKPKSSTTTTTGSSTGDSPVAAPGTDNGATPSPSVTKVVDGKVYVRVAKTSAPPSGKSTSGTSTSSTPTSGSGSSTGSGPSVENSATPEPSVTKVVDGKVYVRVKKSDSATPEPSVTKVVDGKVYVRVKKTDNDEVVGTVKPSSGSGTSFANQATTDPKTSSAKSTTSTSEAPAAAVGANNKSEGEVQQSSFSAAGVAGVIVIGCVAIAGIAVFVSYRKNQQRQRDIMQNGGIHVL